jgi:Ni/Co efflux regulator RcnB
LGVSIGQAGERGSVFESCFVAQPSESCKDISGVDPGGWVMKKILAFAAIAALGLAIPAWADDHNDHKGSTGGSHSSGGSTAGGPTHHDDHHTTGGGSTGGGSMGGGSMMSGSTHHDHHHSTSGGSMSGGSMSGGSMMGGSMMGGTHNHSGPPKGWSGYANNHRGPNVHVNISLYHKNFTSPHRYHFGHYNPPPGYYNHRWTYGEMFPRAFWVQDYWINDFWNYGLDEPPPGLVWVRYGDDALLIDEDSGEVVEVEYDVFY